MNYISLYTDKGISCNLSNLVFLNNTNVMLFNDFVFDNTLDDTIDYINKNTCHKVNKVIRNDKKYILLELKDGCNNLSYLKIEV